jgi:NO-binding membrane sensor protein with MHYT domain
LRRRFVLGAVPGFLAWLPMGLTLFAMTSLILAIAAYGSDLLHTGSVGLNVLPFYLGWLMSLGAIGAIAFIGMNALSIQEDITFDLTNRRLIILRIALGALFGLVITLPFGFNQFVFFFVSPSKKGSLRPQ